jgi:hypothetical protein
MKSRDRRACFELMLPLYGTSMSRKPHPDMLATIMMGTRTFHSP